MAAYPLLFEAALVFFSARFSFRDLEAAVLALFFFGDLSAIGHPSLGSTDGFGAPRLPLRMPSARGQSTDLSRVHGKLSVMS
jgi:hypothetical protein